mmetsp:Transcript_17527/g.48625  ORF Transcript_17527/g.48625 Transcript_17527/m.48625 type:complete len:122 (-) Transcript_17527:22-387(-)
MLSYEYAGKTNDGFNRVKWNNALGLVAIEQERAAMAASYLVLSQNSHTFVPLRTCVTCGDSLSLLRKFLFISLGGEHASPLHYTCTNSARYETTYNSTILYLILPSFFRRLSSGAWKFSRS